MMLNGLSTRQQLAGHTMIQQGPSPELFFDTVSAYQRTEALRTAIELDLFSQIAAGHRSVEEIAAACNAAPRGIRILSDFLTILGFLQKTQNRYELAPESQLFLVRSSPAYLGNATRFMLSPGLRQCFYELTAAVRKGGTAVSEEGTVSHDNPIWIEFAHAMGSLMQLPAQQLAVLAGDTTDKPIRVLDVAAGHGLFGIAIAKRFPQAHVTALDWQNVLSVASENARKAGVSDRYSLIPGSAFDVDWGGPYDLVLLTNFLHHFDIPTCQCIASKTYNALASKGRAITLEFIPDADRITPPSTAAFALVMLASTARGDAYTFAELEEIFARGGFTRSEFHALPPTTQQAVVSYKE